MVENNAKRCEAVQLPEHPQSSLENPLSFWEMAKLIKPVVACNWNEFAQHATRSNTVALQLNPSLAVLGRVGYEHPSS